MESSWLLLVSMLYVSSYYGESAISEFVQFSQDCDLELVNPFSFTGYTCSTSNGSIFIQWRVSGFGADKAFAFSNLDPVGTTLASDGFFATLTSVTNGLQSILTFEVTNQHNGTEIICEDPGVLIISSYNITLRGPPPSPALYLRPIESNRECIYIDWTDLCGQYIVSSYNVSLSDGRTYNVTNTTSIKVCDLAKKEIDIFVVAIDNAGREGEKSDVQTILVDIHEISALTSELYCDGNISNIIVTWETNTSSRPPVTEYFITYTIDGIFYSDTTNTTYYLIEGLKQDTIVVVSVKAGNIIGNGTASDISILTCSADDGSGDEVDQDNDNDNNCRYEWWLVLIIVLLFLIIIILIVVILILIACFIKKYQIVANKVKSCVDKQGDKQEDPQHALDEMKVAY